MKLVPRKVGPFRVKKIVGPVALQVDIPAHWGKHMVFHILHLTLYKGTQTVLLDAEQKSVPEQE